jgi:hypothetical protein
VSTVRKGGRREQAADFIHAAAANRGPLRSHTPKSAAPRHRGVCTLSFDMRCCWRDHRIFAPNNGARRLFVAGGKFCMQEMGSGGVECRRRYRQLRHRAPTHATVQRICLSM